MNHQTTSADSAVTANGATGDNAKSGLAREYHDFLTDVEHLISSATSLTSDDLVRAKARLTAHIVSARASVVDAGSAAVERARSGAKATDQYVRAQPWQAVGISAVAGILIGFMLGRRGA